MPGTIGGLWGAPPESIIARFTSGGQAAGPPGSGVVSIFVTGMRRATRQPVGCSVSATKSLIHRGRETLKLRLKPYLQTGAWQTGRRASHRLANRRLRAQG